MKKLIITIIIVVIVLLGIYKVTSKPGSSASSANVDNPDLILYWGQGCPHCENVKKFITKNNIDQKIKISQKEVYYNKANQKELTDVVTKYCPSLNSGQGIGVPVMFDPKANTCSSGDEPIITYITQKTGQNNK